MTKHPLSGLTVLEVGVFMAGPFATMQLADLGARVVKVENPAGPDPVRATGPFLGQDLGPTGVGATTGVSGATGVGETTGVAGEGHSSPFARLNRNKESVALDLKSAAGKSAFLRLVDAADAVVENLRPGAMRKLGLDHEVLRDRNPRLVYASASGWGQDGELAELPGLDIMAQARSGLMSITGTPDGDPAKVGVPICDLTCGLYTALAVTAALRHQEATGQGQHIDVSLFESGVSLAVWEAGKFFATGEVGGPLGSAHQTQAPYQAVRTADGFVTLGAITPRTWTALCATLGLDELAGDPRYADASSRHVHRERLLGAIETVTTRWRTDRLVEALQAAAVPCAPIHDYGEVFTDPQLSGREFFWDAGHPAGPVRQVGSPMRLSATPTRRDGAGPLLGADTRSALRAVGMSDDDVDALVGSGAAGQTHG